MINSTLLTVAFMVIIDLTQISLWGSQNWFLGILLGAAVGISWCVDRKIGTILGLVGFGLLIAGAFGLGNDISDDSRAMFNGMSLGGIVGIGTYVSVKWKTTKPLLIKLAQTENANWLWKLLGNK